MNELMASIRRAIAEGTLDEEEDKWLVPGLRSRDVKPPPSAEPQERRTDEVLEEVKFSTNGEKCGYTLEPEAELPSMRR